MDGLTALGMSANQSNDFVDMLSATIVNSNTGVAQMQSAFTNVAPIAGTLGVSMSDLSVAIGLMSNQGVKAEKSGTALKNLLTNLASPTDDMTKCIKQYNLESAQKLITEGKLIDGIKEMKTQLDGLTAKEKTAVISTIAGKEALSGVSALLNSSTKDMNNLKFAVDSSTKSSKAYAQSLGLVDKEGKSLIKDFDNMSKEQQKAYKQWENFNTVMEETTDTMTFVGGSTTDLGAIVAKLGEDGKVSADNVNDLLNVFDKLQDTSDKTTQTLKEYGIEIQRNDDGSLNFKDTLKSLGTVWDDLSESEKKSLASKLGLKESVEELNELYSNEGEKIEDLVDAYAKMEGVSEHLAKSFDATLKGSILNLSSAIEERLLQIFDKLKPSIQGVTDTLTKFFDAWNNGDLSGGLSNLASESAKWGETIKNAIASAFDSLNEFVNGKNFDNVLKIGTNIIKGICDGILQARDSGTLASSIDGIIKKICDWIEINAPTVEQGARAIIDAIKTGISNNSDRINSAFEKVFSLVETFLRGKKDIFNELGVICGATFIKGAVKGLLQDAISSIGSAFATIISSIGQLTADFLQAGIDLAKSIIDGFMSVIVGEANWSACKTGLASIIDWLWELNGENNGTTKAQDAGLADGERYNKGINSTLDETKTTTSKKASEIGQGISDNIVQKLETMDASALQSLGEELKTLQSTTQTVAKGIGTSFTDIANSARTNFTNITNICRNQMVNMANICRNQMVNMSNVIKNQAVNWANAIRTQMVNCANICRNQFVSMANVARNQMVNISNIVRNQAVNWSNIIKNQVTNARNALTTQFISMANVARTQMVNVSNVIRNQAVNWSNIIKNQSANMRNAFTQQMMSMTSVARNQMSNVYSVISSYMSKIVSSVNRSMTLKVNVVKTITTTNVTKNASDSGTKSLSALSEMASNTFSALSNSSSYGMGSMRASSSMGLGTALNAITNGGNQAITIEVPLHLDGRQIAKASATYNQAELNKLSKRKSRKQGI